MEIFISNDGFLLKGCQETSLRSLTRTSFSYVVKAIEENSFEEKTRNV